ncbi:L,D-transpeptidase [Cryomorphaceae bacterium]|nr:L,D-transpeptidase [Cryomorphaceae bacterium]
MKVLLVLILTSSFSLKAQTSVDSIVVDISEQRLYTYSGQDILARYPVSTSAYGIGSQSGSNRTPLGWHRVHSKYGDDLAPGAILKGRVPTGEMAEIISAPRASNEDHVTTRILWLEGLEKGKNKGEGVDSFQRYIYIHGTHEEGLIGQPASHGCVRMMNDEVIELYRIVPQGTSVYIQR